MLCYVVFINPLLNFSHKVLIKVEQHHISNITSFSGLVLNQLYFYLQCKHNMEGENCKNTFIISVIHFFFVNLKRYLSDDILLVMDLAERSCSLIIPVES